MEVSEVRTIQAARKRHVCDWCNEWTEAGEAYSTWFCYDERVSVRMQPECYEAQLRGIDPGEELPPRGEYRRGCWCGERAEDCHCTEGKG